MAGQAIRWHQAAKVGYQGCADYVNEQKTTTIVNLQKEFAGVFQKIVALLVDVLDQSCA